MSAPFVRLEIGPQEVRLHLLPFTALKKGTVTWVPHDLRRIYGARGRINRIVEGVAFEDLGEGRWYFWVTSSPVATVLSELEDAGFPVSWEEREVRL